MMNYNYLLLGIRLSIGLSISLYTYYLFKKRTIPDKIIEDTNKIEEYGYGYIINVYPVLIIYIKGYILNNNKNNLQQTSYPNGFPEDSYVIIFFEDIYREYIGVVNMDEFNQIKNLIIDSKSKELDALKILLLKEYFDVRNEFAKTNLNNLIFTT